MSIRIRPGKDQVNGLQRIAKLGAPLLERMKIRLDEPGAELLQPQQLVDAIGTFASNAECENLVSQLVSLRGLMRRTNSCAADILKGLNDHLTQLDEKGTFDFEEWSAVNDIVVKLIESKAVRLATMAVQLNYDYANLLQHARILSDVRPIFNDEATDVDACVVSFTLRLNYSSLAGSHDVSIALDHEDIQLLQRQCERALTKAETARSIMVERAGIPTQVSGKKATNPE